MDSRVEAVAAARGIELPTLVWAGNNTERRVRRMRENLGRQIESMGVGLIDGIDVLLMGSFARLEVTADSDLDYLVVVSNTAGHRQIRAVIQAADIVRADMQVGPPGRTGTFGDFVTGIELYSHIGLESDTNANTTRRILLLFESVSVLNDHVTQDVREHTVQRYVIDYAADSGRTKPVRVPHFLLNDLIRYWRTIAVDFGAKKYRSLSPDWGLRYAKLLTTRKVMFAGSLASLLMAEHKLKDLQSGDQATWDREAIHSTLLEHLMAATAMTPLGRLCDTYEWLSDASKEHLQDLLLAYEEFLAMLEDREVRSALARHRHSNFDDYFKEVERIGQTIDDNLNCIFLDDTLFAAQCRRYMLF